MEAVIGGAENITDAVNALSVRVDKFDEQAAMLLDGKRELYERYNTGEIDLEAYKAEKCQHAQMAGLFPPCRVVFS